MEPEKLQAENERLHAMLVWLAKRYARDTRCYHCPAKLSVCNQDGNPHKMRKVCSALIIEAAEKAVQDADGK